MQSMLSEIIDIALRSIAISLSALLLCSLWSIPAAVILSLREFRGRSMLLTLFSSLIAVPTVTIALVLYMILSRRGFFGFLELLFTPYAIIIGEAILITPYLITFLANSLSSNAREAKELAIILGASNREAEIKAIADNIESFLYAMAASFSRAIGELGIALMVGGNLKGFTRVFTTAIALETMRGEFELSMILSIILLAITISINLIITYKGKQKS